MERRPKSAQGQTSLFQVYLRLRPPISHGAASQAAKSDGYLTVEPPSSEDDNAVESWPKNITIQPPTDSRKRAVEKFVFTRVFEERANQLDIFEGTGMVPLIEGVLAEGRDGLVATLGVTGSGKTHTVLGSKSQRGLTQMSLDLLFRSLSNKVRSPDCPENPVSIHGLAASDPSEAHIFSARSFIESIYGDMVTGRGSRAQTPLIASRGQTPMDTSGVFSAPRRPLLHRPSAFPQQPDISDIIIPLPQDDEYVVLVSMYEVYNDRIFDLLAPATGATSSRQVGNAQKDRRRPLLFKSTEGSTDRKVVAGLRKIVCGSVEEALMVLDAGLTERRVAGTGSNSVSSRSHGFFCVEVKKRVKDRRFLGEFWAGNTLTIVDLAGSERARNAKTAGATLAEAGKINESLMYLGQCLQLQSGLQDGNKALVPFRQCKLTELLFSNSFPSSNNAASQYRCPQRAIMLVTADPLGDFNATTQILRYSALAREVTVPRIPSVTSTITAGPTQAARSHPPVAKSYLYPASAEELETAALEIAQISDEYKALAIRLAEEEIARSEAELMMRAAEERCLTIEQDIREECWAEMEQRMEEERRRWQSAWDEQASRHDEHLDKKLDLLSTNFTIYEDVEPSAAERARELEQENSMLRNRIKVLERELNTRSPTKSGKSGRNVLHDSVASLDCSDLGSAESDIENAVMKIGQLKLQANGLTSPTQTRSPGAKYAKKPPKRMTTRQRDLGPETSADDF